MVHKGEHEAIIDRGLFDAVQHQLNCQARRHRRAATHRATRAPLTGRLFDGLGESMTPTFSRGASGRLYRYYVSASLQQGGRADRDGVIQRVSAVAIERLVEELVRRWLPTAASPLEIPISIRLREDGLFLDMSGELAAEVSARLSNGETIVHSSQNTCRINVPVSFPLRGGRRLIVAGRRTSRPDRALIAGLRRAHAMVARHRGLPVVTTAPASRYERELLRLAFLAPELQRDILAGRQPPTLTLERLRSIDIPLCWSQQREVLGWSQPGCSLLEAHP